MSQYPKLVYLLIWESKTAGDAMRTLLDEVTDLHHQADLRRTWATDWKRRGDHAKARRFQDNADGIEHAALAIESALLDALALWQQYEQQDP